VSAADPLAIADRLSRAAGLGAARATTSLAGGRNNRVYAVDLAEGDRVVMKVYFRHPGDTRDRLRAEWRFLQHSAARAPHCVPAALACDAEAGAALYQFIEGGRYERADASAVAAAADFVAQVAAPGEAMGLDAGSEACFSIAEHLATVERRIARLSGAAIEGPHAGVAQDFIAQDLAPAWRRIAATARAECAKIGLDPQAPVAASDVIASPSDFGFHNAIRAAKGPVFIDFEYAGRDDPAKLVCDFFCQPAVPVPPELHEVFQAGTLDRLGLSHHRARAKILLDAYRIKWIAIMLNEFMAVDESRRAFSNDGDRAARRLRQLDAGRAKLAAIDSLR
jgi:hypothetical protein